MKMVSNSTYWYRRDHNNQNRNMAGGNDGYGMNNNSRRSNRPYNSNCLQLADHRRNNFRPIQLLVCRYQQVPDFLPEQVMYQQCHFQDLSDIFRNQLIHRLV